MPAHPEPAWFSFPRNPMPNKEHDSTVPAPPVLKADHRVNEADMELIRVSTKAALDAQPKVTIRLPRAAKNEVNYETVQINGYTYQIMRGTDVQVPIQVKEILVEANIL